jgi:hypothetical protein
MATLEKFFCLFALLIALLMSLLLCAVLSTVPQRPVLSAPSPDGMQRRPPVLIPRAPRTGSVSAVPDGR